MPAKSPEEQAAYDAARKRSERAHLRLGSDDAARLRTMAAAAALVHGYPAGWSGL